MAEEVKGRGNPNLRIIIVDDESTKIPETLGITPERENELDEMTKKAHNDFDTITDSMVEISKNVRHANELAYCIFHIGANIGRAKAVNEELAKILSEFPNLPGGLGGSKKKE